MDGLAGVISNLIDSVASTNQEQNNHILALYKHCSQMHVAMSEYKIAILELQQQVRDLQSNATDKILLEGADENKTSGDLGSDNEYRADTNDR